LIVLIRFAYLAVTNAFAVLRLLPRSDRDKDIEILALRHQLRVLQRHLDGQRVRFAPAERAFLAALVNSLPRGTIRRLQLLVSHCPQLKGFLGWFSLVRWRGVTVWSQISRVPDVQRSSW
jgi:hypothetical protein